MIVESKQVELYVTEDGVIPYEEWVDSLGYGKTRDRIDARITRLELGNLGKCKPVGGGVTELILDFGPGYRIYIGQEGARAIILLCGGDKSTQKGDIQQAREYWTDYQRRAKKARQQEWLN
jgi:putative addiction module killer protein